MAAKGIQEQDSNPQDLNLIYKSLGELDSEGEKWKEYTENVTSFILENLYQSFWAKQLRIASCFDLMEALPKI